VSKDDLNRKFPGVTEIVINLAVNDPDIINLFGEYIHTDRLKLSDAEIAYLKDTVEVFIGKKDVCHCKDLYEYIVVNDPTLLTNNFVQSSFSLYSVLDHLFGDLYNFSRPYIARKNATIERGMDILEDIVQESERMDLAEIQAFAREHRVTINSIRDFIDACNETHLLINDLEIASIGYIGITEEIARNLESRIVAEIDATTPIHQLHCIHSLPKINVEWTAWLIYSVLKKWSTKLEVGASSNQFKNSYPIVAPIGKLDASMFDEVEVPYDGTIAQVDDLSKIDELISDYVLDEWEDLYEL
ncbi:MAG: hypothetical protein UDG94_03885, partial [Peptococcaceae bacterium]|nr:hypothetical protein [Peptococcaceae bacterium]